MLQLMVAGTLGRDAEFKTTQNGTEICRFTVAGDVGYGENKQTLWIDVTRFGKGAEGLSKVLRKGSKVAVIGELSTREHNGKTYLQCRASEVKILGAPAQQKQEPRETPYKSDYDDLDDSLPPF